MTALADAARELVERSTAAQGLPLVVEDEGVYRRIATLISRADDPRTSVVRRRRD
jgi:hypothetical protein